MALLIIIPSDPLGDLVLPSPVTFSTMRLEVLVPSWGSFHYKKDIIKLKASPVEMPSKKDLE